MPLYRTEPHELIQLPPLQHHRALFPFLTSSANGWPSSRRRPRSSRGSHPPHARCHYSRASWLFGHTAAISSIRLSPLTQVGRYVRREEVSETARGRRTSRSSTVRHGTCGAGRAPPPARRSATATSLRARQAHADVGVGVGSSASGSGSFSRATHRRGTDRDGAGQATPRFLFAMPQITGQYRQQPRSPLHRGPAPFARANAEKDNDRRRSSLAELMRDRTEHGGDHLPPGPDRGRRDAIDLVIIRAYMRKQDRLVTRLELRAAVNPGTGLGRGDSFQGSGRHSG